MNCLFFFLSEKMTQRKKNRCIDKNACTSLFSESLLEEKEVHRKIYAYRDLYLDIEYKCCLHETLNKWVHLSVPFQRQFPFCSSLSFVLRFVTFHQRCDIIINKKKIIHYLCFKTGNGAIIIQQDFRMLSTRFFLVLIWRKNYCCPFHISNG